MFLPSFTENLMTYALGRRVEYTDMPAVRAIVRDAAKNDNRLSSFVLGVVNSAAFRMGEADTGKTERRATDVAAEAKRSNSSVTVRGERHVSSRRSTCPAARS